MMKLSLVTVAFDPDARSFPRDPLAQVEGEVLSVVDRSRGYATHTGDADRLSFAPSGRPDGDGSRTAFLCRGADQAGVRDPSALLRRGTEAHRPRGGRPSKRDGGGRGAAFLVPGTLEEP